MDSLDYLRFLFSLLFVLGLVLALAWAARRYGLTTGAVSPRRRSRKRLAIIETQPLDAKHRLVLVRRDGVEHLILVGATSLVVERGITPPAEDVFTLPDHPDRPDHPGRSDDKEPTL